MKVVAILALLLSALCVAGNTDPFEDWNTEDENCHSVKWIVSNAILRHAVSYFGDHQREELKFEPNKVSPFTPSGLFKAYYGEGASAVKFAEAILEVIPSSATSVDEDRNIMRRNLYSYVKSSSYEYAREKASYIFKAVINDFIPDNESNCAGNPLMVLAAQDALQVELAKLRNEVGDALFGDLFELKVGSSLAFVIDDTGSMGGEIEAAKQRTREIVKLRQGSLDAPNEFVLVPFNDPSVGPVTRTRSADEFDYVLSKLRAHGGGDAPEMCMKGIQLAIENSRPGSVIYVITDIHAKDFKLQDSVLAEAQRKNIQITFLLTNDLRGSCHNSPNSIYKECRALYEHLAEKTGGKLLVFSKSAIFDATKIVEQTVQQAIVTVVKAKLTNDGETRVTKWLRFPVSPLEEKIGIDATGRCREHKLRRVDKNQTSTKMDDSRVIGDLHYFELNITSNRYGLKNFTASFPPGSTCDVTVNARSSVDFLMKIYKRGRGKSDYTRLESQPAADDEIKLVFDSVGLSEKIQAKKVSFVSTKTGEVLESFPMSSQSKFGENSFELTNGVSRFGEFYAQVHGTVKTDTHGELPFVRTISRKISVSSLLVNAEFSDLYFRYEVDAKTNITILNTGATDEFVITSSDPLKLSSFHAGDTKKVTIEQGGTAIIPIKFHAPGPLSVGKATIVTVSVTGTKSKVFQYASSYIVVGEKKRPRINSLVIDATINARYAETVITSQVTNNADVAREAEIEILLPRDAFVTELIMELEDETIIGKVEEKVKAEKIYRKAKQSGLAAGHVAARDDSTRAFRQSVLVEPRKNVTFILKYQQMMRKVLGEYEYAVVINPRQPVKHMKVTVNIIEDSPLGFIRVPAIQTEQSYAVQENISPPGVTITRKHGGKSATIVYKPTVGDQQLLSPLGLSGSFRVIYDVTTPMHGQVAVNNGYFVHFFAPPTNIPVSPRLVVFVLDTSGSMYGQKLKQLKTAMNEVLNDLNKGDRFNLVAFGGDSMPWVKDVMPWGNEGSVQNAKEFVDNIEAFGGTNIFSAVESAVEILEPFLPDLPVVEVGSGSGDDQINDDEEISIISNKTVIMKPVLNKVESELENYAKMIVLLTDGKASTGITDSEEIISKITAMNKHRFNLHTVGFGSQADMGLMKKLAGMNGGNSRRIFEGLHAGEQIKRYLTEVTSPVLRNISIDYEPQKVEQLTKRKFNVANHGGELAVAGHVGPFFSEPGFYDYVQPRIVSAQISAISFENEIDMGFDFDLNKGPADQTDAKNAVEDFTERMWAFMRLQDMLRKVDLLEDSDEKSLLQEKALNMSLQYNFVTRLTSIIALRDEDRKAIEDELKKETTTQSTTTTTRRPYPIPFLPHGPMPALIVEDDLGRGVIAEESKDIDECFGPECEDIDECVGPGCFGYSMACLEDCLEDYDDIIEKGRPAIEECSGPGCVEYEMASMECRGPGCDGVIVDASVPDLLRKPAADAGHYGGGFSGDPHFLIPLFDGNSICFNWDGFDGQVYNLIHDNIKMVAVNGMLKNVIPAASNIEHKHRKTYVSEVAFMDLKSSLKCLITPYNVTIVQRGAENLTFPLKSTIHVKHKNIEIFIDHVKKRSGVVRVVVNDLVFQITALHDRVSELVADHVDFGLINNLRDLDVLATGALGQFRQWMIEPGQFKVVERTEYSKITIRDKTVKAFRREVANPINHSASHCWFLKHAARSLTGKTKETYLMNNMFDTRN